MLDAYKLVSVISTASADVVAVCMMKWGDAHNKNVADLCKCSKNECMMELSGVEVVHDL